MSFLSRRTSRSEQRGGRAGDPRHADSDYDDHTPDGYQGDDDNWSPDEYFSPDGIKGRWAAGTRQDDRPAGRGGRDDDRGYDQYDAGQQRARGSAGRYGRDSHQQDSYGPDEGYGDDYGTGEYTAGEEYGTGAYEAADGPDRAERGGGRRRRADRGERRLRLGRRDKGDDIWPDDGVSDEDYWASVTADRPMTSNAPLDADPMNVVNNRPMARPSGAGRPVGDSRPPADRPKAAESRFVAESRTGSGRLGPAPGQAGYLSTPPGTGSRPAPGGPSGTYAAQGTAGPGSGPMPRAGSGPMTRAGSGPMPRAGSGPMTRAGSGPMPRASSGPMPRHGTGPSPAWPAGGPGASGSYPTRSTTGPTPARSATGPAPARPATGPTAAHAADEPTSTWFTTGPIPTRPASTPAPARPATRPSAQRPAAGLARPGLSQPGLTQPTVAQPVLAQPARAQPAPPQPSFKPTTGRGPARPPERTDRTDWADRTERIDRVTTSGYPDTPTGGRGQAPAASAAATPASVWGRDDSVDRHLPDARDPGRRGADDDPLTSRKYSRQELMNTDGRSYRVAASRRTQITPEQYAAALAEQTQTFSMSPQYPADPLGATGGYPVHGQQPGQQSRASANPYDQATASYPYPGQPHQSRAAAPDQADDHYRPARPGAPDPARNPNPGYPGNGYGENGRYNPGGYGNGRK